MSVPLLILFTVPILLSSWLLPYPVWFYLPAIVRRFTDPTLPNQPVKWLENVTIVENLLEYSQDISILKNFTSHPQVRPNILLIIADDLGVNDISDGIGVKTPNIDSIRENGINFQKGYSGHATCAPSRAAIMTGKYATRFGFEFTPAPSEFTGIMEISEKGQIREAIVYRELFKNAPKMEEKSLPRTEIMLSEILNDKGYHNYYLGKWHLGENEGYRPLERGYHESLSFLKGASLFYPTNHKDVVNAEVGIPLDDFLTYNLEFAVSHNNGPYFEPNEYMTDYLSKQASEAIRSHTKVYGTNNNQESQKPFFMTLAYNAPHDPFQAKRSDYESDELMNISDHISRVYAAMIKSLDRGVGNVLNTLKETNQYENTLIIFTSDNGAATYLGLMESNKPFRGGKATLFEGGIRVPFFMQWPKILSKGLIYDKPVGHVDIFTTVMSAANITPQNNISRILDGRNLFPFILSSKNTNISVTEKNSSSLPHESLYWRSSHYKALLYGDYKLQVSERPDKVWLHNLVNDPYEYHNLAEGVKYSTLKNSLCSKILQRTEGKDTISSKCSATLLSTSKSSSALSLVNEDSSQEILLSTLPTGSGLLLSKLVDIDRNSGMKMNSNSDDDVKNKSTTELILEKLMLILEDIDSQQSKPQWDSLVEVSMSIDRSKKEPQYIDEEYVYWAN